MTTMRIPNDTRLDGELSKEETVSLLSAWPNSEWDSLAEEGIDGEGIFAAYGDTGINLSHSCFSQANIVIGKNYTGGNGVQDFNGHGTHCGSLIVGKGFGPAPKAKILVNQVLSARGSGSTTGINQGLVDAAKAGCLFYSGSYGSNPGSESTEDRRSIEAAYDAGLSLYIVAAGNAGFNGANTIGPPGSYEWEPGSKYGVLTVGALRKDDSVANFSSGGKSIDVAAPGEQIPGASHNGDKTVLMSGTSAACPIVTGLIVLIAQQLLRIGKPLPMGYSEWINFLKSIGCLLDLKQPGFDFSTGYGRIQIQKAIDWLRNPIGVCLMFAMLLCGQLHAQEIQSTSKSSIFLVAETASVFDYGEKKLIEVTGFDAKQKYGQKIKIESGGKYTLLATDQSKVGFNPQPLISLGNDLWLLIGDPGQQFQVLLIRVDADGFPSWNSKLITIPKPDNSPSEPSEPPTTTPDDNLQTWVNLAKSQALLIDDKATAKQLSAAYFAVAQTLTNIDLNEAYKRVAAARSEVLLNRKGISLFKDWNPFLTSLEKALSDAKISNVKQYSKIVEAWAKGLTEASK